MYICVCVYTYICIYTRTICIYIYIHGVEQQSGVINFEAHFQKVTAPLLANVWLDFFFFPFHTACSVHRPQRYFCESTMTFHSRLTALHSVMSCWL